MSKSKRGFASMTPERRREVARKGGTKTAEKHDMTVIGKKGGDTTAKRGSAYYVRIGSIGGKRGKRGKVRQGNES